MLLLGESGQEPRGERETAKENDNMRMTTEKRDGRRERTFVRYKNSHELRTVRQWVAANTRAIESNYTERVCVCVYVLNRVPIDVV